MALIPPRFRFSDAAATYFPSADRFVDRDVNPPLAPFNGSPFPAGGAAYLAFCSVWAPPFELDEDDVLEE